MADTSERVKYALDIDWDKSGLPSLVGPFDTAGEARHWGDLNVPNGVFSVRPMRWPYLSTPPDQTPAGGHAPDAVHPSSIGSEREVAGRIVEPGTGIRPACPTCEGPTRETVNMVCPTCGFDYACTCGRVWEGHPNPHAITCPRHVASGGGDRG